MEHGQKITKKAFREHIFCRVQCSFAVLEEMIGSFFLLSYNLYFRKLMKCLLFTLIKLSDYSVQMVTLFWSHLLIFIKIIKILSSDLLLPWVDNKTGKEIFKCLCLFATADLILSLISELLVGVVSLQLFSHVVCIFCQKTVWVRCHVERTFAFNKPK